MARSRSLAFVVSLMLLTGCGGNESQAPPAPEPSVERGEYVAEHLGPCGQCHSPKDAQGMPIESMRYSGDDCFLDIDPMDDTAGCLATPNLTNHETGLKNRTDADIKEMMVNGRRPDGTAMFPFMPYWLMHTLPDVDIDSIILYLRTMPAVDHAVPPNQPPFDVPIPAPAPPLAEDERPMPATVNDATMRGRDLATYACLLCHTPLTDVMDFRALDKTKLFAGGSMFVSPVLGYPSPPLPNIIYSTNLTPHPTSGSGYTKAQLIQLLKTGKDKGGIGICPPMPIGNAYGGLTDTDLSDMADYLLALPAIDNTIPSTCMGP